MLQTLKKLRNRVLLVYNVYDVSRGFVARAWHFRGGGAMLSIYIIGYETGCPSPPPFQALGWPKREEREDREGRERREGREGTGGRDGRGGRGGREEREKNKDRRSSKFASNP